VSTIELLSPLTPDECAARLREVTDQNGLFSSFGSKPLIGSVSSASVQLRKRIGYRNSFQTVLTGTIQRHDGGAVFRGRTSMHPFVIAFMAVWGGFMVLMGAAVFVASVGEMIAGGGASIFALVPPLMLVLGIGMVYFCRHLARGEEQFLITIVAKTIDASGE
jgi:hypothetical protein